MSRVRTDERLAAEAASRRRALREEQEAHGRTLTALRATNRELLRVVLADRLEHPEDLELYMQLEKLTDDVGRIVWPRVDAVVSELLVERPNLAARAAAGSCRKCGLRSQTGPVERFAPMDLSTGPGGRTPRCQGPADEVTSTGDHHDH